MSQPIKKLDEYSSNRTKLYHSVDNMVEIGKIKKDDLMSKRRILYNSADHNLIDIKINQIQKKPITNSCNYISLNKSYKVTTQSAEEVSSEEPIKSDVCFFYDHDGYYNLFELRIICQQIKCTGHMKTSTTSFDLIMEDYNGIRCQDDEKNYIILSKRILKTKTIPFVKKSLPLSITENQSVYYPIYVICHHCEFNMVEFESLFPQLIYNMINH